MKELRICKYSKCDNTFEVSINDSQKYCSRKCASENTRNIPRSKEVKEKIGRANFGRRRTKETKQILRELNLGENSPRWIPPEIRICECGCEETFECKVNSKQRFIHGHHNKVESYRKRQGNNKKGKSFPNISAAKLGHIVTKETRRKIGDACRGKSNPKLSVSIKRLWQDPEYVSKQMIARGVSPNKAEKRLNKLLQKIVPNEYQINVKAEVMILGGKIPDFVNVNGQKKIIEFNGDYWHGEERTGRTKEEEEQQRINHFAQFGWKTLIIWEHELEDIERLKNKILEFSYEKFPWIRTNMDN